MSYSFVYKGYQIDFAPFLTGDGTYGAQWTIRITPDAGKIPISSGDLGIRGSAAEMAEVAKLQALQWIEQNALLVLSKRDYG